MKNTTTPGGGGCFFCSLAHQMWNRLALSSRLKVCSVISSLCRAAGILVGFNVLLDTCLSGVLLDSVEDIYTRPFI